MVLHMLFLVIMQESKLIHTILYLYKNIDFFLVIIIIQSAFDKDKNNYHYNVFLEKRSYKSYKYAILR